MIKRNERGRLTYNNLDMQVLFDELFYIAENENEVDWIYDNLLVHIETAKEDAIDSLESDDEE